MVQGGFPGSALITQLFRQFTKPISQRIVNYGSQRPKFRKYFLLMPGRTYHRLNNSLEVLKESRGRLSKMKFKQIEDEEAVQLGSQLMIEIVIFALLVLLVILDALRSLRRTRSIESRQQAELRALEQLKSETEERVEQLQREIDEVKVLKDQLLREIAK